MTHDNNEWLRIGLARIADKATVPDLATTARHESRRLAMRRTVLVAAVVLVAVAAVGATWKVLPARHSVGPPSDVTPSVVATPSVKPSVSPTDQGNTTLTGTAYYFSTDATFTMVYVNTFHAGKRRTVFSLPIGTGCPYQSIVVSPDGRRLAWVASGDPAGFDVGGLVVAAIDGTGQRTLAKGVACLGSSALTWTADSRSVRYRPAADREGIDPKQVDVTTGVVSRPPQGYGVLSADGAAFFESRGNETVITDSTGTVLRTVAPYKPRKDAATVPGGYSVRGLSAAGRYTSFGMAGSDPSRLPGVDFIVDTTTGKEITLPGTGVLRSALFLADGRMLIESQTTAGTVLMLLSADATLLDQTTEPAGLGSLLAYVG